MTDSEKIEKIRLILNDNNLAKFIIPNKLSFTTSIAHEHYAFKDIPVNDLWSESGFNVNDFLLLCVKHVLET